MSLFMTVNGIVSLFLSERPGGASERACRHRGPAEGNDDALLQKTGGVEGRANMHSHQEGKKGDSPFFLKDGWGLYSKMCTRLVAFQKLDDADDDSHLDSDWSDRQALKRQFQGLNNIKWGPR